VTIEPRPFRRLRSILVESLFWDARTHELAWVDITEGTFHRARLEGAVDGSDDRIVELPPPVSAVQPAVGGGYVAALKDRIVALDADGRISHEIARVAHAHGGIRFNEGKADPFGRFVVGGMDVTSEEPDAGLYAFAADGTTEVLRGGFAVANGMEWSDEGREMFVTDTGTKTIYRARYGPGGEALGELEPFVRGRMSDGLVRDAEGGFWNGIYGDGEVVHLAAGGEPVASVSVPAPNVTSVAFGGPSLDLLFIGTARENLDEQALEDAPLSGSIFVAEVGVRGRPVHVFGS
jgi:sugar lactone lactonase YvrE